MTARTRRGIAFDLEEFYDVETLWQIFCRQVYDVHPDDRLIVDAGANIGLFACYAAQLAPHAHVHAIEPFPRTFDRLVGAVRRNGLGARITCHQVALSSSDGIQSMTASGEASQMCHLLPASDAGGIAVQTTTLDQFLSARVPGDAPIDLLKMDIEGLEYDVLLSTPYERFRRIRRVNLEFHDASAAGAGLGALVKHLARGGLRADEDPSTLGDYGMLHFTTSL